MYQTIPNQYNIRVKLSDIIQKASMFSVIDDLQKIILRRHALGAIMN
jgi:hypothetical protein